VAQAERDKTCLGAGKVLVEHRVLLAPADGIASRSPDHAIIFGLACIPAEWCRW